MKLFLSAYFAEVASLLPKFTPCRGLSVAFIPNACDVESVTFYKDADIKALEALGMSVTQLDISKTPYSVVKTALEAHDVVFVEGGNTFYLLQVLRHSGVDQLLVDHIRKGKLYIGSSAGSMILSRTVAYAVPLDDASFGSALNGDFTALDIVPFSIVPHFGNPPFVESSRKILDLYSRQYDLRPLGNHQAVVVDEEGERLMVKEMPPK